MSRERSKAMSFIRKRNFKYRQSYQLVQTYREKGKVKHRVASLGEYPTVEEALQAFRQDIVRREQALESNEHSQDCVKSSRLLTRARDKVARLEAVRARSKVSTRHT
jgi:hypothetical protein